MEKSLSFRTGAQRLQRTQIIWVCSDIWVFLVLDNRLLADNLSHLPKVAIWIRKGQIYSFPPWWNTKTFETVKSFSWNWIVKCIFFAIQGVERIMRFFVFFRDVRLPQKMDVFLENFQTALTPPLSLFGNYIALFSRKFVSMRKFAMQFLDWRWPPLSPPLFGHFFQNLLPKYTALKPTKSAM